jgi:hypothetical protein
LELDQTLIEASRRGDERAFGLLVERYKEAVFATAVAITRDFEAAQDVAARISSGYHLIEKPKRTSNESISTSQDHAHIIHCPSPLVETPVVQTGSLSASG